MCCLQKLELLEERLREMALRNRQLELEEGEISEPCPSAPAAAAAAPRAMTTQTAPTYNPWEDDP
jgi:hypothetical protein